MHLDGCGNNRIRQTRRLLKQWMDGLETKQEGTERAKILIPSPFPLFSPVQQGSDTFEQNRNRWSKGACDGHIDAT